MYRSRGQHEDIVKYPRRFLAMLGCHETQRFNAQVSSAQRAYTLITGILGNLSKYKF